MHVQDLHDNVEASTALRGARSRALRGLAGGAGRGAASGAASGGRGGEAVSGAARGAARATSGNARNSREESRADRRAPRAAPQRARRRPCTRGPAATHTAKTSTNNGARGRSLWRAASATWCGTCHSRAVLPPSATRPQHNQATSSPCPGPTAAASRPCLRYYKPARAATPRRRLD